MRAASVLTHQHVIHLRALMMKREREEKSLKPSAQVVRMTVNNHSGSGENCIELSSALTASS